MIFLREKVKKTTFHFPTFTNLQILHRKDLSHLILVYLGSWRSKDLQQSSRDQTLQFHILPTHKYSLLGYIEQQRPNFIVPYTPYTQIQFTRVHGVVETKLYSSIYHLNIGTVYKGIWGSIKSNFMVPNTTYTQVQSHTRKVMRDEMTEVSKNTLQFLQNT